MANRYGALLVSLCCVAPLLALGVAGCSSSHPPAQAAMMVDTLPSPNFDGPEIADTPPPVAVAVTPAPLPPPPGFTGIPREWTPQAKANAWQWIVIHHSATPTGGAAAFDKMHKAKGWDELGYHFVVGNGTDTGDGQVEVGPRWSKQKWGAHAKTSDNRFNRFGIGICLVGNFDNERPTKAQLQSLSKLVAYLMKSYNVPADRVIGHGETKATDCPGRNVHIADIRQMATAQLAAAGDAVPTTGEPPVARAASGEMLSDLRK
jgi:N-acetylmuramoyl-L-alanine amidase